MDEILRIGGGADEPERGPIERRQVRQDQLLKPLHFAVSALVDHSSLGRTKRYAVGRDYSTPPAGEIGAGRFQVPGGRRWDGLSVCGPGSNAVEAPHLEDLGLMMVAALSMGSHFVSTVST